MIKLDPTVDKQLPSMIKLIRDFVKSDHTIEKRLDDADGEL